jgi:hypothetical protein
VSNDAGTAKRLYESFLAPLVIGGELSPGPAVGARAAFALTGARVAVDSDLLSRVDVARVRMARRLVPVDTVEGPSRDEWALAAALHDLVHSLHPGFDGVLHRSAPDKLADFTDEILTRVPAAHTLGEEVSRHTYFARMFEIERTDTRVSWWTGSQVFLGTAPTPRLLAWPELRRVQTERTTHLVSELPMLTRGPREGRFWESLQRILLKLPLTDLATCARPAPAFRWNGRNLGLFASPHSRVVAHRALSIAAPATWVDATLARATRLHVKAEAWDNIAPMAEVLADRAVTRAASDTKVGTDGPEADAALDVDAAWAQAFGAVVALRRIESLAVAESSRAGILERLRPIAESAVGRELSRVLGATS